MLRCAILHSISSIKHTIGWRREDNVNEANDPAGGKQNDPQSALNDDAALTTLLGDLLQTVKDGEEGFQTAAQDVDSKRLRDLFTSLSLERASIRAELQGLVKSIGEPQPDAEGSVLGAAHRGWIELRAVVASQNIEAILDECGRGEDSAVAAFSKALDQEMPASVRVVLADQCRKIKASRTLIYDLHAKAKGAKDQQARW